MAGAPSLVGLAAGALREARLLAGGLEVDAARMYRNIELTNGMIFSDAVAGGLAQAMGRAEAYTAVEEEVANVVRSGGHLRERLTKRFPAHHSTILQAFELAPAINAAASRCRAAQSLFGSNWHDLLVSAQQKGAPGKCYPLIKLAYRLAKGLARALRQ